MSRAQAVGLSLAVLAFPRSSLSQAKPSDAGAQRGAATFKTYCAPCHGERARGDGPMAEALRFAPADLTTIARRNGGRFPSEKVAKIIDGREAVKGHGGTDMPIWGDAFKSHVGYDEKRVKAVIAELVQHLATLQQQPEK